MRKLLFCFYLMELIELYLTMKIVKEELNDFLEHKHNQQLLKRKLLK